MPTMAGTTIASETIDVAAERGTVRATVRHPAIEQALSPPTLALICDPLPLAGDASDDFAAALAGALLDAGLLVGTYEPQCAGLILDDYDTYTAAQSLAELKAVWSSIASTGAVGESDDSQRIMIATGIGALVALAALPDLADVNAVCLVNPPVTAELTGGAKARTAGEGAKPAPLPTEFVRTMPELRPDGAFTRSDLRVRAVSGAADALIAPTSASHYTELARAAGCAASWLLVALGDHAFTDPAARQAALQPIVEFCTSSRPA